MEVGKLQIQEATKHIEVIRNSNWGLVYVMGIQNSVLLEKGRKENEKSPPMVRQDGVVKRVKKEWGRLYKIEWSLSLIKQVNAQIKAIQCSMLLGMSAVYYLKT